MTASHGAATLLVVAKAPEPGRAKTRLRPALSAHQSAAVATAALLDTLDAARESCAAPDLRVGVAPVAPPVVALTGDLDRCAAPAALRAALAGFRVVPQRGDGFADRLAAAHLDAAGAFGATVQIGMDTPQVPAHLLRAAGARVTDPDGPDAVLGPASDGGWWLLALRRGGDARLLTAVPMSRPDTGELTVAALRAAGLTVELTEVLTDVDEPDDLVPVAAAAPGSRFAELVGVLTPLLAGQPG